MNFNDINKPEVQEAIQDYVNGTLTGASLQAFEQALTNNQALAEEVAFSREMVFVLQHKPLFDVKQQLQDIAKENSIQADYSALDEFSTSPESGTNFFSTWKGWLLSGLLVVGLVGVYFGTVGLPEKQLSEEQRTSYLNSYLAPYENVITIDTSYPSPMIDGLKAYDEKDYALALKNLELYPENDDMKLYVGIAKVLNKDAAGAIDVLKELASNPVPVYQIPAKWYLALAYLDVNKLKECKFLLEDLKDNVTYGPNAKALLLELQ